MFFRKIETDDRLSIMARHYRNRSGYAAALRHIEEAEKFTKEIGGTDKDVKKYFFDMTRSELDTILVEYGNKYGVKPKLYAQETFEKWRKGTVKMSGLVAKRLFNLLPPRMPLQKKYELAENVWKHFGPSSSMSIRVGPNADVINIIDLVSKNLIKTVTEYTIPDEVKNRFNWLAAGDVQVKEKLLNYFRKRQENLVIERAKAEIPVLQRQMLKHPDVTGRANSNTPGSKTLYYNLG